VKRIIIFFIFLSSFLAGCGERERQKVYKNADFGFSITYPVEYQAKELKWVKESTGVILQKKEGSITIQAMAAGTNYENMPFKEYARIAAAAEIQNFNQLISIESFTSDYDIKGYRTYWEVVEHEDTDTGEINALTTVGPIYYFPPLRKQKLGSQPVKTIMLSCNPAPAQGCALQKDAEEIARSFRYLNSLKSYFKKGQHGKLFFVKKNKPFRIELPSNPTTGYNWFITDMDENYFKVHESGYEPPSTKWLGAGGKSYWEIIPLKEGLSSIRLLYYRSWEGKSKAVDEFSIRVIII